MGPVLDAQALGLPRGTYIETLARRWNAAVDVYRRHAREMTLLKYEDFLDDKAGTIATLAQALGQPSRKDVLETSTGSSSHRVRELRTRSSSASATWRTSSTCAATMPLASDTTCATDRIDPSRRVGRMICGFGVMLVAFAESLGAAKLVALHDELAAGGVRLVLARAVGQVRDVLGCVTDDGDLTAGHATIAAAVNALGGADPTGAPTGHRAAR